MAAVTIFSSLRRRKPPCLQAFVALVDTTDAGLVQTLASISTDLLCCFSAKSFFFQKKNCASLLQKVQVFLVLLEYLTESVTGSSYPSTAILCFKEMYLLLYRSRLLLDYCFGSSKLWLLLQTHSISGHFHDLNQEISTILDVFPLNDIQLSEDVREQIQLLQKQSRKTSLYNDQNDEALRLHFFSFLDDFDKGKIPNPMDLRFFFVNKLGVHDALTFRAEIDFLEQQILTNEGDVEPTAAVLNGFVAITRYCRFLVFGLEEDELPLQFSNENKSRNDRDIADSFITIPKDFCCPVSWDLMMDPVIISTGQTYDRSSISRWLEESRSTCPKTGQMLVHTRLIPNRALRNLISQWCTARGIPYEPPLDCIDSFPAPFPTRASLVANKATAALLIQQLAEGSPSAKMVAAREIRFLAKTGKENRAFIAEAGAIPHLLNLLSSENPVAQENSVTAILNLSIYDRNKNRIIDEEGCLASIINVLRHGITTEARENAAATLFSLSAVHDYKKRIACEEGAVEALAGLLRMGTPRGKKDAVTALFNLSTHADNCMKMIEAGAVSELVGALINEVVSEEAAGALALIVRQQIGAEAVGMEEKAVAGLITMMRCGTPRGKENAVAALLELCRSGGTTATEKVLKAPALLGLLQMLLFTGTKRARRKAASLAKIYQRCENAVLHFGYSFTGNSASNREASFVGEHVSISVPVL